MNQEQQTRFISGLESANLLVNSGLLQISCEALEAVSNSSQQLSSPHPVICESISRPNCLIVAFGTSPICTKQHLLQDWDLVASATLSQQFSHFDFLCSKGNPTFSIPRAAINLFINCFDQLLLLKSQVLNSTTGRLSLDTQLIVTGHALGGAIASLFTLSLLDSINQMRKRKEPPVKLPLCITFGSPLLGDKGIQRAISERSNWSSCFLHVAANKDPFPGLFLPPHGPHFMASSSLTDIFKPFGTYLLCSERGCVCVENPEEVSMLLEATRGQVSDVELPINYYSHLMEDLNTRLLIKGRSLSGVLIAYPLEAGLILLIDAIGVDMTLQSVNHLIMELGKQEKLLMLEQRKAMDPIRQLNAIKIKMAYLEWYKKCCKTRNIGYYDSYKRQRSKEDIEVAKIKKYLTNYWKTMVEAAEKRPRKEVIMTRVVWLYSGTNCRRMIEPLEIADYHRDNSDRNYRNLGRPTHFKSLEKWLEEEEAKKPPKQRPSNMNQQRVAEILTKDSCFWAEVEEALISCALLKNETTSAEEKGSAGNLLRNFDKYVMEQINLYAVSPEIFLEDSGFMKWWREFQEIPPFFDSEVARFMRNDGPRKYENGSYGIQSERPNYAASLICPSAQICTHK